MKKKRFSSEAELAAHVVKWLEDQGWTVYKEVELRRGGVADIVAVMDGVIWIIETKNSLSCALAVQGAARLMHAHYVSIACPTPKTGGHGEEVIDFFCRFHGVGRIAVTWNSVWEELEASTLRRWERGTRYHRRQKKPDGPVLDETAPIRRERCANIAYLRGFLCEGHRASVAGSKGGGHITEYKKTIDAVRAALRRSGVPMTMKELVGQIDHHYSSASAARRTLPVRLLRVEKDFRVENGLWLLKEGA